MRRSASLALIVAVALLLPAASAHPLRSPEASREDIAIATWFRPPDLGRSFDFYYAYGYHHEHADGDTTHFAGVGRGVCRRTRRGESTRTLCEARVGAFTERRDGFEMDPLVSGARIKVRGGRRLHRVEWRTATEEPFGLYLSELICDQGFGRGGGLLKYGAARGRVAGRRLVPKEPDLALLLSGASASYCGGARELLDRLRTGRPFAL